MPAGVPSENNRMPNFLGEKYFIKHTHGLFSNPKQLAHQHVGTLALLHTFRFTMAEDWDDTAKTPTDTIDDKIYANCLEAANAT